MSDYSLKQGPPAGQAALFRGCSVKETQICFSVHFVERDDLI